MCIGLVGVTSNIVDACYSHLSNCQHGVPLKRVKYDGVQTATSAK